MMCVSANGAVLAVGWMLVGRLGCMTGAGKKRVRKSPEERKAEIVAAAVKLIGEKGFYGTSLKDIADGDRYESAGVAAL